MRQGEHLLATSRIMSEDGRIVSFIAGPIDSYSAPRVRELLESTPRDCDLVVDLSECSYVDTAGLWVLRNRAAEAERSGGSMVVRCPSPRIHRTMRKTGFDRLVVIEEELAAGAFTSVSAGSIGTPYRSSRAVGNEPY